MTFIVSISGSLTLSSTMTIAGTSRIQLLATGTITTNGKTWPNDILTANTITLTLADDFNITGLLSITGATTINGTFNINVSGGTTLSGVSIVKGTGAPRLYFKGGTVQSTNALGRISIDSYIDGNITIGDVFAIGDNGSINYVSGVVTNTANNTVTFANLNVSINLVVVTLNNVNFSSATNNYTITLLSNLNINGLLTTTGGTISGSFNINCFGGVTVINNGIVAQGIGITTLNLLGGTWSISGTGPIRINTNINGNITISGTVRFDSGTLTYTSGNIIGVNNPILNVSASSTFINCDKLNIFKTVNITSGTTQTFNQLIRGTASNPLRIQCGTAGSTYTVAFQDTFEKIANNVKVSGCIVSRPGQLIINGANSNKGTNTGIRYINQYPNGLPKNSPPIPTQMTFGIGNISDPTIVIS